MTYQPKAAPPRRFKHASWRRGFLTNSKRGSIAAKAEGYNWVDNDGSLDKDHTVWNAHGAPEKTWPTPFSVHSTEFYAAQRHTYGGKEYRLRTWEQAIIDNAAIGLNTELEAKLWRGVGDMGMDDVFAKLAVTAREHYGPNWRSECQLKVLTNLLKGQAGIDYALRVCTAATKAGFWTILLVRGTATLNKFTGHEEITYIRGSKRRLPK